VEDLLSFGDGLCTQVIIALLLKRGAAPFQWWFPRVIEGWS
jgi:NADH:ubiquinone oxidoreductase subunit 2 (subunit N)